MRDIDRFDGVRQFDQNCCAKWRGLFDRQAQFNKDLARQANDRDVAPDRQDSDVDGQ